MWPTTRRKKTLLKLLPIRRRRKNPLNMAGENPFRVETNPTLLLRRKWKSRTSLRVRLPKFASLPRSHPVRNVRSARSVIKNAPRRVTFRLHPPSARRLPVRSAPFNPLRLT